MARRQVQYVSRNDQRRNRLMTKGIKDHCQDMISNEMDRW